MTIEEIQQICSSLESVTEDIKWGEHLCFNIGGKMFLITSPDRVPPSASFKASDEDFHELSSREGFMPAPHLARYKWIYIEDISLLGRKHWEHYIKQSYQMVVAKLPKKKKKELGLGD